MVQPLNSYDQTDLGSIPLQITERLRLFNNIVGYAIDDQSAENVQFSKYYGYIFESALTAADKQALKLDGRPTLNFPILKLLKCRRG